MINLDNKDKNDKKRLSRVELYDSPKSQKRSFLSRKRASQPATPINNDESSNTVNSRRRQIVDRPQKSHHGGFFSRLFNGRHRGKLYKTILFALLGILVVMIIVFAVKQQHPVNTDSTDTSVSSSSSSHHSRKHKRSHSSSSDDNDNYGDSDNQATYQIPASRSDNNGNSSQGQNNNNQGGSSNQSGQSNNNGQSDSQNQQQQQPAQQPSAPSGGQQAPANGSGAKK